MLELMQKQLHKSRSKKGFTLVEVIVVLVILAILAAILVPSMVKWIDKAETKTAVVEGRTILLAAQTIASEKYPTAITMANDADEIVALADIGVAESDITALTVSSGKVTGFTMTSTGGHTVTYATGTGFTVS